jgi:hypothetical protein
MPSDPGLADLTETSPMGSLQFSVGEVEQALLNLNANKGPYLSMLEKLCVFVFFPSLLDFQKFACN